MWELARDYHHYHIITKIKNIKKKKDRNISEREEYEKWIDGENVEEKF